MPVSRTNMVVLEFKFINKDVMSVTFVLNDIMYFIVMFFK